MKEEENDSKEEISLWSYDKASSSSEVLSSGTEGSFFDEEDKNLIEKEMNIKKNVITNTLSFTNKFEFNKNGNCLYNFTCQNKIGILLMNIFSIILFLLAFNIEIIFYIIFKVEKISNYFIIIISILLLPFLICTLIKMIKMLKNSELKDNDIENKDLNRLVIQKWNIYYSISLFLFTINLITKLLFIDILRYHSKIILFFVLLIIIFSLVIFGIIYYLTKSSNNILITGLMDNISFPLSISMFFSFIIIMCIEQFKTLIYTSPLYSFLISCISLLLMVYYDDILFAFIIFLYQLGGIKSLSFYNMNFHTFCTLINLGFILFMTFKSIRKNFFSQTDDNVYSLVYEEELKSNEDDTSD